MPRRARLENRYDVLVENAGEPDGSDAGGSAPRRSGTRNRSDRAAGATQRCGLEQRSQRREAVALERGQIIEYIVGRRVDAFARKSRAVDRSQPPVLEVVGLSGRQKPLDVSLQLYAGEVLGIAGLLGAGRSELARVICGIDPPVSGEIRVRGTPVATASPQGSIASGIALIPEDRRTQGLILDHTVAANMSLPTIDRYARWSFVQDRKAQLVVSALVERLRIKTRSVNVPVRTLSGGNQQKVVLGKWLAAEPDILVLDEPTAGVDIGSKSEIVDLIRQLADAGKAVIMISSELAELLSVSDRILILSGGRITREIPGSEIDAWAPSDADAAAKISATEQALQLAIQEAEAVSA